MTAVTDTIAVLEGLAGKTLDNAQMLNIVENYLRAPPMGIAPWIDLEDATNEEKAAEFLRRVKIEIRNRVREGARDIARLANEAATVSAEDAALIDL